MAASGLRAIGVVCFQTICLSSTHKAKAASGAKQGCLMHVRSHLDRSQTMGISLTHNHQRTGHETRAGDRLCLLHSHERTVLIHMRAC